MPARTTPQQPATVRVFSQRFSSTRLGARLARHLALHQLDAWGVPYGSPGADTTAVIVAELVANAVTHGRVHGRDFELKLTLTDALLWIEVSDARGEKRLPPPPLTPPPADEDSGRGLLLVEALADRWCVLDRVPVGKTVRAELDLPGGEDDPARAERSPSAGREQRPGVAGGDTCVTLEAGRRPRHAPGTLGAAPAQGPEEGGVGRVTRFVDGRKRGIHRRARQPGRQLLGGLAQPIEPEGLLRDHVPLSLSLAEKTSGRMIRDSAKGHGQRAWWDIARSRIGRGPGHGSTTARPHLRLLAHDCRAGLRYAEAAGR